MTIERADEIESSSEPQFKSPRRMPTGYVVVRGASQTPEILHADNDEMALTIIRRQVQASLGATPVVFVYKMVSVVQFVADSQVFSPEAFEVQATADSDKGDKIG